MNERSAGIEKAKEKGTIKATAFPPVRIRNGATGKILLMFVLVVVNWDICMTMQGTLKPSREKETRDVDNIRKEVSKIAKSRISNDRSQKIADMRVSTNPAWDGKTRIEQNRGFDERDSLSPGGLPRQEHWLSVGNEIHMIECKQSDGRDIAVMFTRYYRNASDVTEKDVALPYRFHLWNSHVKAFLVVDRDVLQERVAFNWNATDVLLDGSDQDQELLDDFKYRRISFAILPAASAASERTYPQFSPVSAASGRTPSDQARSSISNLSRTKSDESVRHKSDEARSFDDDVVIRKWLEFLYHKKLAKGPGASGFNAVSEDIKLGENQGRELLEIFARERRELASREEKHKDNVLKFLSKLLNKSDENAFRMKNDESRLQLPILVRNEFDHDDKANEIRTESAMTRRERDCSACAHGFGRPSRDMRAIRVPLVDFSF